MQIVTGSDFITVFGAIPEKPNEAWNVTFNVGTGRAVCSLNRGGSSIYIEFDLDTLFPLSYEEKKFQSVVHQAETDQFGFPIKKMATEAKTIEVTTIRKLYTFELKETPQMMTCTFDTNLVNVSNSGLITKISLAEMLQRERKLFIPLKAAITILSDKRPELLEWNNALADRWGMIEELLKSCSPSPHTEGDGEVAPTHPVEVVK